MGLIEFANDGPMKIHDQLLPLDVPWNLPSQVNQKYDIKITKQILVYLTASNCSLDEKKR